MAKPRPVLATKPITKAGTPVTSKPAKEKCWTFSFRFWRQIEYFGLDHSDPKWFVSLLEKLGELSGQPIEAFMASAAMKQTWRYHPITWTHKNIPIQRSGLTWLPKDYLDNDVEFPLSQFQISKGLGRIVGFWDESDVFQIVLLDPLHNIQPSGQFDYKVNPCSPLPCIYTTLLHDVERVKQGTCQNHQCAVYLALQEIPGQNHVYDVTILRLREDLSNLVVELVQGGQAKSVEDILEHGATALCLQMPKDE